MTSLLALIRRRLFRPAPATTAHGGMMQSHAGAIHDGLAYDLPVIVTEDMRKTLGSKVDAYVRESAAQTFRHQFDTPYRDGSDLPIAPVTEDPLTEWHFSTRKRVLSNCHAAYHRNPIAGRGVNYYADFVIGPGFNLTVKNKDVERVLNAFIDNPENDIRAYERQAVIDLLVDGELFLRFFTGEGDSAGQVVMVPMRPWEVESIKTAKGFFRRVESYQMQRYLTEGDSLDGEMDTLREDAVPAAEVQHVAINRHGYELRGRPELYRVLPWLRAYKEWLENRARQNYWRGALLWWIKVAGATPAVVSAILSRWSRPPSPGSVAVESDKVEVSALTNPVGAGDAGEDGRRLLLMNAVGLGLPEYFLADGSNANLASTKSQQMPALMTFGATQRLLIEKMWYPVFERVINAAIEAGDLEEEVEEQDADGEALHEDPPPEATAPPVLPRPVLPAEAFPPALAPKPVPTPAVLPATKGPVKMIKTVDAFEVSYEPIGDHEPFTLAQALQIATTNEWVSNETAATEMGYDYAIEQKRRKREMQADQNDIASGLKPPPILMTPPGDDEEDDADADERDTA